MTRNPTDDLQHWSDLIGGGDYSAAKRHLFECVEHYKTGVKGEDLDSGKALATSGLFRALYDFTILKELTEVPSWWCHSKTIEQAWGLYWDCIERFDFVNGAVETPVLDQADEYLTGFKRRFDEAIGTGNLYASPEIIIKRETCSICRKDIRACDHVPGRVYGGLHCQAMVEDFDIRAVSFVRTPKDPRCRIWSWCHVEREGKTYFEQVAMMCLFSLTDFLKGPGWADGLPARPAKKRRRQRRKTTRR